jgi:uncharacterized integral membrane protein
MVRKVVSFLFLAPLAIAFVSLAVANRQPVVISLDPFDPAHPAYTIALPLFALMLAVLLAGVIIGGVAAWLRQSKWRRAARYAEGQARDLQTEVDERRAQSVLSDPIGGSMRDYGGRLTIPPPAA